MSSSRASAPAKPASKPTRSRGASHAAASSACAARLVALVPTWMREIRAEMRHAAPDGLSVPLFRALVFARAWPGGSVSELAAHLGVTLPTASVAVDKLVEQGLLESRDAPDSKRRRALHLTPAGTRTVARSMSHTIAVFDERLRGLDAAALARILEALDLLERTLPPLPARPGTRTPP